MSDLPKRLRIKASMIALGERIAWGSDTALMEEAADVIEALSASVENHQLHMLGMARDRDQLRAMLTAQPQASAAHVAALSAQQSEHVSVPRGLLQDLRDLAYDAVDHHRQAFAGYKLERQARMDHVISNADALLNRGEA